MFYYGFATRIMIAFLSLLLTTNVQKRPEMYRNVLNCPEEKNIHLLLHTWKQNVK